MLTKATVAGVSSLLLAATVRAETLLSCAGQPYDASMYTCFDGDFLCPITGGVALQRCGDACYSPAAYSCNAGGMLAASSNVIKPKVLSMLQHVPRLHI